MCNMDCLNCIHKDCINDSESTLTERDFSKEIDLDIRQDGVIPKSTKYYRENPERCIEYQRKSVNKNKKKVYDRNKKYRDSHQEEIRARNRQYYLENRESILEKAKSNYIPHPLPLKDTQQAQIKRKKSKEYYDKHKEEINRKRREKRRKEKEEKCMLQ